MIHRDIKPRNILVTKEGLVKVTDFGIAGGIKVGGKGGAISGDQQGTRMGAMMGTQAYMSPEQFRDPRQKSAEAPEGVWYESDVYSFGVCLWEMICGRRPREISIGVTGDTPDPQSLRRDIPAGLKTLLLSSVELDRGNRPQDFSELREKLNGIYRYLYGSDAPHYQLELHDTTADELNNQGYSYYELGKKEEARKCFEAAVEVNNTHPEAVFNLALLQWRAGEIDDLEALKRVRNCTNHTSARKKKISELLAYIHVERFDPASAEEELKEYYERYDEFFGGITIQPIGLIRTFEGHSDSVTAVSLSVDGKYALSGSEGTTKLWDASTGQCLRTFEGHSIWVYSVSLRADGKNALSCSEDNTLKLWEVSTGLCLRTFEGHDHEIYSVSLSADGKYALSGSNDHTLKLWEVSTGQCLRTFEGHIGAVKSVSLSADGKYALSGSADKTLKLWDMSSGQCLRTFEGHREGEFTHSGDVNSICLSADGRYALSGSNDMTLKLWDVSSGQCLRTFEGHRGSVISVCLSADGKYAISAGMDMKLWDVSAGRCLRTFEWHSSWLNSVSLSADGKYALSGDNGGYSSSKGSNLKLWEINIKTLTYNSELQVSDFKAFDEIKGVQDELKLAIQEAVRLMNNGKNAQAYTELYSAWERDDFRDNKELLMVYQKLYELSSRKSFSFAYATNSFDMKYRTVCLSDDGRYVLSGRLDNTLELWEASTGQCLRTFEGHDHEIYFVSLSADGKYALSGSRRTTKLWDTSTGQCLRTFDREDPNPFDLSADGRYALSKPNYEPPRLLDLSSGQQLHWFGNDDNEHARLSADGRYVISWGDDDNMRLWDASTGQCLQTFEGHSEYFRNSVCLSADGKYVLSVSSDNTLELWEASTGQCLRTFEGHNRDVTSMCLSADGKYALSWSDDKMLKLWEVPTGLCLHTFEGHSCVDSLSLSADGKYVISCGKDFKWYGSHSKVASNSHVKLWRLIWKLEFD